METLAVSCRNVWHCHLGPFTSHVLNLIPMWMRKHIHHKAWDEIICTVEVVEWISNFFPRFCIVEVWEWISDSIARDYLSMLRLMLIQIYHIFTSYQHSFLNLTFDIRVAHTFTPISRQYTFQMLFQSCDLQAWYTEHYEYSVMAFMDGLW